MTELLQKLGIVGREGVERFIEDLIAVLDEMDPDPEAEPELGAPEQFAGWRGNADQSLWTQGIDGEPWLGWPEGRPATAEMSQDSDREEVNEDGGDINDEPHDDDELEPFMGWTERDSQGPKIGVDCPPGDYEPDPECGGAAKLHFNGDGNKIAQAALSDLRTKLANRSASETLERLWSQWRKT